MTLDSCSQEEAPPRVGSGGGGGDATAAAAAAKAASASDLPRGGSEQPRTLPEICHALRRRVMAFLEEEHTGGSDELLRNTQGQARVSMGVIEEALRRYRPEEISLSYNGGKDCLVLLVLLLAGLAAPPTPPPSTACTPGCDGTDAATAGTPDPTTTHRPLQGIYIAPPDPFPEVEDFVTSSTKEYHLDLTRYALRMRPALEAYLGDRKAVKAIFMGTRRTDPHCEFLTHFSPTDKDWPQFMRVNPMIDWHYTEIWTFIRHLGISYCSLYDRGFSSLGGMDNTRPNPALALDGGAGTFRPAYELVRDDQERLGRDR